VSGSEKLSRLDHDGKQQASIANVENDDLNTCAQPGFAPDQRLCRSHSVEQMT